ncbi:hypothetical protein PGT21_013087 [Puccinia graminis f. sp. tritici]|uniref:Uncharacterized protein n=1 Tax=Puccinia graminis f. sp. tritici TaxID=56615 RepID=A0A5B0LIS4_PUCGR|nr:hypothetical protein PGT21_013087 [Puccinia graminis f. sp. tritici]
MMKNLLVFTVALLHTTFPDGTICLPTEATILKPIKTERWDPELDGDLIQEAPEHAPINDYMIPIVDSPFALQAEDYGIIGSAEFEEYERWFYPHSHEFFFPSLDASQLPETISSEAKSVENQTSDHLISSPLRGNDIQRRKKSNALKRCRTLFSPENPPEELPEDFILKLFGWVSLLNYPRPKNWKVNQLCIPVFQKDKSWKKISPTQEVSKLMKKVQDSIIRSEQQVKKADACRMAKILLTEIFYRNAQFLAFFTTSSSTAENHYSSAYTEIDRLTLSSTEQESLLKWLSKQFGTISEASNCIESGDSNCKTGGPSSSEVILSEYLERIQRRNMLDSIIGWETRKNRSKGKPQPVSYYEAEKTKFTLKTLENYYRTTNSVKWIELFPQNFQMVKLFALLRLRQFKTNMSICGLLDDWSKLKVFPWNEPNLPHFESMGIEKEINERINHFNFKSEVDTYFYEKNNLDSHKSRTLASSSLLNKNKQPSEHQSGKESSRKKKQKFSGENDDKAMSGIKLELETHPEPSSTTSES